MDQETRLEKNRSGKWEIRWSEPDAAHPGKWRSRGVSTRTEDRVAAEAVRRAFIKADGEITAALAAGPKPATLEDVLAGYETACKRRDVGVTTMRVITLLRGEIGDLSVTDVTPEAVAEYGAGRGVASGTLRRELGVLTAALTWGAKHRLYPGAPPAVDLPPGGTARTVFLDAKTEGLLFTRATQDEWWGRISRPGLFTCVALDTGARKAAVEGLTWDRVDMVRETLDFRDPGLRATKKRRVATPITTRLKPVLERAWRERAPKEKFVLGSGGGNVRGAFESFIEKAGELIPGLDGVTPHVLRHTRITLLLQAGVSVWDVSALVGASPTVIQEVYGHHVSDGRLRSQADRRVA